MIAYSSAYNRPEKAFDPQRMCFTVAVYAECKRSCNAAQSEFIEDAGAQEAAALLRKCVHCASAMPPVHFNCWAMKLDGPRGAHLFDQASAGGCRCDAQHSIALGSLLDLLIVDTVQRCRIWTSDRYRARTGGQRVRRAAAEGRHVVAAGGSDLVMVHAGAAARTGVCAPCSRRASRNKVPPARAAPAAAAGEARRAST